jgi:hypothetical protein
MRTPGRCTNSEGCWISASHRNVWLPLGEEFVCPNCGGNLAAPLAPTRSFRTARRIGAISGVAALGMTVIGLGAVKLSIVSWPGQPVAAKVVEVMGVKSAKPSQLADKDAHPMKRLTQSAEQRPGRTVALAGGPNAPLALTGAPSSNTRANTTKPHNTSARAAQGKLGSAYPPSNPTREGRADGHTREASDAARVASRQVFIYKSPDDHRAASGATNGPDDGIDAGERPDRTKMSKTYGSIVMVAEAALSPTASTQPPVILPITFGQPLAPETDFEPVTRSWRHRGVSRTRHWGPLPAAAAAAESKPANVDANAEICRIPSLMH